MITKSRLEKLRSNSKLVVISRREHKCNSCTSGKVKEGITGTIYPNKGVNYDFAIIWEDIDHHELYNSSINIKIMNENIRPATKEEVALMKLQA